RGPAPRSRTPTGGGGRASRGRRRRTSASSRPRGAAPGRRPAPGRGAPRPRGRPPPPLHPPPAFRPPRVRGADGGGGGEAAGPRLPEPLELVRLDRERQGRESLLQAGRSHPYALNERPPTTRGSARAVR